MLRKKAFHALEVAEKELEVFDQSAMKSANQTIKTKQKILPFVQKLRDCREQFKKRYLEVERLAKKHDDSGKLELEMKEAMKQATEPIDSVWHEA
ncbi:hypothetical protein JCM19046_4866 [Bacillus sp. JCM 19046]|nr:hypothetical protein JCM19046_4866 [Bacillus sp. JCM 19046]